MSENNVPIKHFYLLRHGESEANSAKRYAGQIDSPLTKKGKEQALRAAEIIAALDVHPLIVIHSHLQRARETARPAAEALGLEMIEEPGFAEINYGDWQGQRHEDVRHLREAGIDPPNGETNEVFTVRIMNALREALNKYDAPLIVGHGGCFKAIARHFGGQIYDSPNCLLHEFIPKESAGDGFPWDVHSYIGPKDKTPVHAFEEVL